jgi:NAD(P)-dependent dehydrogenase (short-subunit alcohol dehydrogenase family)
MALYPDLKNRIVLVTGGANGIGAAMVRAFCKQHARVFFCDTDIKAGRKLAETLGNQVVFSKVDLIQEKEVCRWIDHIGAGWKEIGVLVNNAAADPRLPLHKTTVADWDELFARNLRAYFLTSREATTWMRKGASIINLASITFHNAPANMTAYVATKGGVIGFTRSLARELGPRRIRVNVLSPGWIMTERQLRQYVTATTKRLIRNCQSIPDLIEPEEIADVALFLASKASAAITGQEILADRGWEHS